MAKLKSVSESLMSFYGQWEGTRTILGYRNEELLTLDHQIISARRLTNQSTKNK